MTDFVGFDDKRSERTDDPVMYVVATDNYLSGWRNGPEASYLAYPVYSDTDNEHIELAEEYMRLRSDLKRVRINMNLPRLGDTKQCSLYDLPSKDRMRNLIRGQRKLERG